jgi:hypothetical protein
LDKSTEHEGDSEAEDVEEIPIWWVPVEDLFGMSSKDRRELVKTLTSDLMLSEDETSAIDVNLSTFDAVFNRDENIIKVSTIDANLSRNSPERKTETDVLEIFVRVNSAGTDLSRSDLIFSMLKLNWKESAEGLPEFVHAINKGNDFDLDTDFVIRCLFAVSGLGGKLNIDRLREQSNVALLQSNYKQCCDAIRATVDFVRDECQCYSSRLLGSSTTLVPIVAYMYGLPRHEVPSKQVDRLRKAIYLFGLARPFSRYGESRVGSFVNSALGWREEDDHTFPLETAIRRVRAWEGIDSVEELAEANHLLTLHLIQGLGGAKVKYSRNAPEVDHIFPRAELRARKFEDEDIDDLGNFWILAQHKNRNKSNQPPKEYFENVGSAQLNKALIDPDRLQYRSFRPFIKERRQAMLVRLSRKIRLTDKDLERQDEY